MPVSQAHRQIAVTSALGEDVLVLRRMEAVEEMGRLFELRLDLLSEDASISFDDVLGQSMTVSLDLPDRLPDRETRYFNGFPTYFAQTGMHEHLVSYHAVLRPWFWFLTRTADCRIYQEKSVPEIIKAVFADLGFGDFEDLLSARYRDWDYCVQYRESHFDFISRLMEQEGIYYFFEHDERKHTLVLADDYGAHDKTGGYEEVPYFPPDPHGLRERDHISSFTVAKEIQTSTYALEDYDFERPKVDLGVKSTVTRQHAHSNSEVYDYPGEYVQASDGDAYAKVRIQELQSRYERVRGGGNVRGLCTGSLFELTDFPRADQNREYLVLSTRYVLQSDEFETGAEEGVGDVVECEFEAVNSRERYRSPRTTPVPIVRGPQTAVVVGPSGQEIHTDEHGRVKVQFHWDRYGESDENSSCWIRVSQGWAGKQWGAIHIPRIGQEVVVDFLEGDPDRPLVTGRVYNADLMPPYGLPGEQTKSGVKSRSTTKGSADNFNELRFEDKKGDEEIYFHAEKDFKRIVENDDVLEVGFEKKSPGEQTIDIYQDRTVTLDKGSDKLQIKTGSRTLQVDKGDRTVKINMGKSLTQAAVSITLKVGASSIKIEPAKITIKSPTITVQGDAKVDVKSPMTTVAGDGMLTLRGGLVKIN